MDAPLIGRNMTRYPQEMHDHPCSTLGTLTTHTLAGCTRCSALAKSLAFGVVVKNEDSRPLPNPLARSDNQNTTDCRSDSNCEGRQGRRQNTTNRTSGTGMNRDRYGHDGAR